MAHHKRKGPKSTRRGCLLCKPHKHQGSKLSQRQSHGVNMKLLRFDGQLNASKATRKNDSIRAISERF